MNKEICILNGTKWILGDESTEPMNWEDANNWCKSIGQDLPPREVLLMAFLNPEIRSKFANDYYWSSSEFDSNGAWGQDFNDGIQFDGDKYLALPVRAVRAIIAEASEQTEQEPVTDKPTEAAEAVMPNGVCVSNVYDAYEEGRKSVMSEQEPVAWMWTRNYEGGGYTNKVFEFLNDAEEYAKDSKTLKSPDIICPLYTAPPKHEPLSEDKLDVLAEANITDEGIAGYYLGFRDAEKCHGIGGGE